MTNPKTEGTHVMLHDQARSTTLAQPQLIRSTWQVLPRVWTQKTQKVWKTYF